MDQFVTRCDVNIFYRDQGVGTPVVLLHGAPDTGEMWRELVPELHAAGYRTIVPDLRGFGRSSKPSDVPSYQLMESVKDTKAILRAARIRKAHIVAHDWGGEVAWLLASMLPALVDRLVVFAAAHPSDAWDPPTAQRRLWWYMYFAQSPEAEDVLRRDDFAVMRSLLEGAGDLDRYIRALSEPGALTALLNWSRANAGARYEAGPALLLPPVAAPTLVVSSPNDRLLVESIVGMSADHVRGPFEHRSIPSASHWIPLDEPSLVSELGLRLPAGRELKEERL